MSTALLYLVVMVIVAAVVFLVASMVFGRGEEMAPLPPGATPTELPADDVTGDDVRGLRLPQAVRGYRMAEVDWTLATLADELDRLRSHLATQSPPDGRPGSETGAAVDIGASGATGASGEPETSSEPAAAGATEDGGPAGAEPAGAATGTSADSGRPVAPDAVAREPSANGRASDSAEHGAAGPG